VKFCLGGGGGWGGLWVWLVGWGGVWGVGDDMHLARDSKNRQKTGGTPGKAERILVSGVSRVKKRQVPAYRSTFD